MSLFFGSLLLKGRSLPFQQAVKKMTNRVARVFKLNCKFRIVYDFAKQNKIIVDLLQDEDCMIYFMETNHFRVHINTRLLADEIIPRVLIVIF